MNWAAIRLVFLALAGESVLVANTVASDSHAPLPGWRTYSQSRELDDEDRRCAMVARAAWRVALKDDHGAIEVTRQPFMVPSLELDQATTAEIRQRWPEATVRADERVEGGRFIGLNGGEWGGALVWVEDAGGKPKVLIDENVTGVLRRTQDVLAFTGLAHMLTDYGRLYRIVASSDGWTVRMIGEVDSRIGAFTVDPDGSVVMVTRTGVWRLGSDNSLQMLARVDYRHMAIDSVVVKRDGEILVGLPMFIGRLVATQNGYVHEWLLPEGCKEVIRQRTKCVCGG